MITTNLIKKITAVTKLSIYIFLITLASQSFASILYGQGLKDTKISINANRSSVLEIFKEIEDQSDYKFLYDERIKENDKRLTINKNDISVYNVLRILSKELRLKFKSVNKSISVTTVPESVKEVSLPIIIEIAGTVVDENGQPLAGASISEKGTSNGTITDFDGNFSLAVSDNAVLVILYLGYKTQEINVGSTTNFKIQMEPDAGQLDEIVVIGYGIQKKSDVTGAISSVNEEDFNKGVVTNPGQLLQGKVAGVNISSVSGEPGAAQDIIIRGVGSLRSGTTPLYVIDGFALDNTDTGVANNPLNFINSQDIESIEVLKDASAAAIYGARAANGVIVITTKKGKAGKTQINLSVSTAISSIANKIDVFSADQFRSHVTAIGGTVEDGGSNTDWQDELTRTAVTKSVNFSMSGGYDKFSYYASVGADDVEGILSNSDLSRYFGRLNLTQKALNDRFKVEFNLNASKTENSRPLTTTIVSDMLRSNPTYPAYTDGAPTPTLNGDQFSPLIRQQLYDDGTKNSRILANVSPSFEIIKGLTYKLNLGTDYSSTNRYTQNKPNTIPLEEGDLSLTYTNNTNTLVENFLTYTLNKNEHNLSFLIGHSYQKTLYEARGWTYENFPINGIEPRYQIEAAGNPTSQWSSAVKNELQSFFGRVNYGFANKYLLTATMRADGSSKFGENNKYGYFPSVALGWNISNEDFMVNSPFNNLKLRVSWGQTGSQEIPSKITQLSYTDSLNDNDTYPLDDNVNSLDDYPYGTVFTRLANPDIQWEVTTQTNIGLDFGLFNNKLTGTIDYYNKVSENVLLEVVPSDPIQPTSTYWINVPDMEIKNNGIELALDYNHKSGDFSYNIGGNIAYTKNKIENSPYQVLTTGAAQGAGQTGSTINGYINGEPIGAFYMKEFIGIGDDGLSLFRDVNGDGQILDDDRVVVGSALPDVVYAFYLNFAYKKFDLSLNFNGVSGNKIYNHTAMSNFTKAQLDLSYNTTNIAIEYPEEGINNTVQVSTRYLENGSFLRLNNASLSYNLDPKRIGLDNWVNSIRATITGQNLFVITKYSGFDPEVNTGSTSGGIQTFGIDRFTYPKARTFVLGLNVSF